MCLGGSASEGDVQYIMQILGHRGNKPRTNNTGLDCNAVGEPALNYTHNTATRKDSNDSNRKISIGVMVCQ